MHASRIAVSALATAVLATAALASFTSSPCLAQQSGGAYLLPPIEASRILEDRAGGINIYSQERFSIPKALFTEAADYKLILRDTTYVQAEATRNLADEWPWQVAATGPMWFWPDSFQVQHSFQLNCGSGAFPVETAPTATFPVIGSEPGMMAKQQSERSGLTHLAEHFIPWHSPCRDSLEVIRRNQATVDLYGTWKVRLHQDLDSRPRFYLAKIPNPEARSRISRLVGEFHLNPWLWDQLEDVAVRDRMNAFLGDDATQDSSIVDFLRNDTIIQADPSRFAHLINLVRIPNGIRIHEPINVPIIVPTIVPFIVPFIPAH